MVIIFWLISISSLYTQWEQKYPYPARDNLYGLTIVDEDNIYLSGSGEIIVSTNAGQNWNIIKGFGSEFDMYLSIDFINSTTGWVSGGNKIFKTLDGGESWIEQISNTTDIINHIQFFDQNNGIAITSQEKRLLVTNNGGSIWTVKQIPAANFLEGGYFIDQFTGWVCGQNEILKTTDAGNSWSQYNIISFLRSGYFIDENTGWFVGSPGQLLKTDDGGLSWNSQTSNTSNHLTSIFMLNQNMGWVAGFDGTILKTTNSGNEWLIQATPTTQNLFRIKFVDESIGFAVGENGIILKSTNAGNEWMEFSQNLYSDIKSGCFTDSSIGLIACSDGKVYKTSDAGENWEIKSTSISHTLDDIFFIDSNISWASGNNGSIIFSSDGGNNWQLQNTSILSPIRSIHFADQNNGYAVGDIGTILNTTNGGQNWSNISTLNTDFYKKVLCESVNETWLAGFNSQELKSKLLLTTDGGLTWQNKFSSDSLAIYCFFKSETTLLAGGAKLTSSGTNLVLFKSEDAGNNWELIYSSSGVPVNNIILDVAVTQEGNYVAISKKSIYFSSDGGENWQVQTFQRENLNSIISTTNNTIWISGDKSILLKNTNGGVTNLFETEPVINDYSLFQNYPNPFNPVTKISWQSPVGSWQILKVFDVLGREIATLVNEYRPAGNHTVEFNGDGLASGVYIYQLKAGEYLNSKKMLLVK